MLIPYNMFLPAFKDIVDIFGDISQDELFEGKYSSYRIDMPGGRWSGKTYLIEQLCLLALFFSPKIDIEIFRYQTSDKDEMWKNLLERASSGNLLQYYKGNKYELIYNNNKLRCGGVRPADPSKPVKLGTSQPKCRYKILWIDEFFEFKEDHWDKLEQALRSYERILIIRSSNPWNENMFWVKDVYSLFPPDIDKLLDKGISVVKCENRMVIWSNAIINWGNLSEGIHKLWNHYKENRPNEAKVVCYGLPGVQKGSVFAHVLPKISPIIRPHLNVFAGGLDYGYKKDKMIAILGGCDSLFKHLNIIAEFEWDNYTMRRKDHNELARDIVNFYIDLSRLYPALRRGLIIYCDHAENSFIAMLNNEAKRLASAYPFSSWLRFKACVKLKIATRTGKLLQLFSESRVSIHPSCKNLLLELKMYAYDDNKDEHNPIDKYNHSIDAFCYLLSKWWKELETPLPNYKYY